MSGNGGAWWQNNGFSSSVFASQLPAPIAPCPGEYTTAQIQAMIADAKAQYHLLITGQQISVFVDSNGERITYTAAKVADLETYIAGLESKIAPRPAGWRPRRPGPIGFVF